VVVSHASGPGPAHVVLASVFPRAVFACARRCTVARVRTHTALVRKYYYYVLQMQTEQFLEQINQLILHIPKVRVRVPFPIVSVQ
jgi:hypothetical protein